ncbi:MAG: hypothetical protein AAB616_01355, partial [Patescibacteria group bacterium]
MTLKQLRLIKTNEYVYSCYNYSNDFKIRKRNFMDETRVGENAVLSSFRTKSAPGFEFAEK